MIKSYKFRRRIANFFIYLLLAILGIIWVSPFVYLVMHSFRAESMTTVPYLIPHEWTFDNYIKLFTSAGSSSINFPRWFINTFVVAIFSCIISTISVLAVSYTFSRLRFGARKKLMNVAMNLLQLRRRPRLPDFKGLLRHHSACSRRSRYNRRRNKKPDLLEDHSPDVKAYRSLHRTDLLHRSVVRLHLG